MHFLTTVLFTTLLLFQVEAKLAVFAASSTTDAMKELATAFHDHGGESVQLNFASSGALARQIDAGAPADVYISANEKWMNWLEENSAVKKQTRFNLAANSLVLISGTPHKEPNKPRHNSTFLVQSSAVPSGRIAVGNFKSVPAGMYAEEALTHLGWLDRLRPNLVMASNVRTALLYVQRGEVASGIVYSTDAKAAGLPIIGTFPAESHSPILYPAMAVSEKATAFQFLEFLKTDQAKDILKKHGFADPTDP